MKSLLLMLLALLPVASHAQAPPVAATTPTADVILRTDGTEIVGRVVVITPGQVRYLPPASADTLRLPAADVFLVRYANGTREVLHPVVVPPANPAGPAPPDLLPGLSETQRRSLGRTDARRCYTSQAPFWGSLGATLYGGPLLGVIAPATIAPHAVKPQNLKAPHPALLDDPTYGTAYRQEAQHRKRGRAWGGYAVGSVLVTSLLYIALANSPSF